MRYFLWNSEPRDHFSQIAGKKALYEAVADIASRLIPEFVEEWNAERE